MEQYAMDSMAKNRVSPTRYLRQANSNRLLFQLKIWTSFPSFRSQVSRMTKSSKIWRTLSKILILASSKARILAAAIQLMKSVSKLITETKTLSCELSQGLPCLTSGLPLSKAVDPKASKACCRSPKWGWFPRKRNLISSLLHETPLLESTMKTN